MTGSDHEAAYDAAPWRRLYDSRQSGQCLAAASASIPELSARTRDAFPDRPAFTTCMPNGMSGSLRFADIEDHSDALAVYLRRELGLTPGARVAVQFPNCLVYPVAALAVLKAGCVLVNVNPLYTPREMEAQLADCGAEVLIVADLHLDKVESVIGRTRLRHVLCGSVAEWFPPLVGGILRLVLRYWQRLLPDHGLEVTGIGQAITRGRELALATGAAVEDYWRALGPDDIAVLQYTGGTTGASKGAVLTHGNLLANLRQIDAIAARHLTPGSECVLTALPLYHVFAFTVNFLAFYAKGAHNILVPNPRPIGNCQRALENYPVSWMSGVNTLYNALLNEEWFSLYPPASMRVAMAGGTALQGAVAERWGRVVGCPIIEGYGLTETSPVLCFNPVERSRADTVGIPVPGTDVRIVDESGRAVPPGSPGELLVRGPQVSGGYWNRPGETAESFRDGWFRTGDVAVMDGDGYFRIVDRKKDLILVSGFNVYPNEVEESIARLDAVQESAVVGVPDARTGEAVCAYVMLRRPGLSPAAVREHCRGELASYKVPSHVIITDDLPRTPVGKVLRKALRARAADSPRSQEC